MNPAPESKQEPASGCVSFLVLFVMPIMSMAAAAAGLIDGATLTIRCERITPRQVEEAAETRGVVTIPGERVIDHGRVDVTATRRIIGLLPIRQIKLEDVLSADSSSGTTSVTNSSGRTTSTYATGSVNFTTRAGKNWESSAISHAIGPSAAEMQTRVDNFLEGSAPSLTLWSVPWLSNLVGIPFALVSLFFVWAWIAKLKQVAKRIFHRTRRAPL